jgi:long-chain fatty acid transport protein
MKRILLTTAAFGLAAGMAQAGGVERSHSPYAILWEKGNYAELSFGYGSPDISGSVGGGAVLSGDMADSYTQFGLGLKYAINDRLDVAVVMDQPIGADVAYPAGVTGSSPLPYPLNGSTGTIDSTALTALVRYKFDGGFSVHGGIKAERAKGAVSLPAIGGGYSMSTSTETDLGYLIGAAYEKPEIALRVALTYQSAIKHDFDATEYGVATGSFTTEVPQSVTLDFQSGVAKDTLVFGSIRWRDWTAFDITPPLYGPVYGALVDYQKDVVTWTLGVGRRFNENWSGAISFGYEDANGFPTGNLGPHDGMKSVTLGGTYTQDNMKITAGVSYIKVGDATTNPPIGGTFTDNDAVGFGMKIGYSF